MCFLEDCCYVVATNCNQLIILKAEPGFKVPLCLDNLKFRNRNQTGDCVNFGERLKMVRGNLTRDEFSVKIHVHKNTIGRWERGEQTPNVDDLNQVLQAYPDINPAWLLTGEGEMKREKWPVRVSREEKDSLGRISVITYEIDKFFKNRLTKELRDRPIKWLANESKVDQKKIEALIRGEETPSFDDIIALADVLKVNPRWLAENSPFLNERKSYEDGTGDNILDEQLMNDAICRVEEACRELNYQLIPLKKAELILFIYNWYLIQTPPGTKIDKATAMRFIKMQA